MAPISVTIGAEAYRILDVQLLGDAALNIPKEITSRLSCVTFTPNAPPIAPTPYKLSESAAALWALAGLFSAVISEERYGLQKQNVQIDVHTATLFPMSCFMLQIEGKGIWTQEVKGRMDKFDPGKFTEAWRGLATNMYVFPRFRIRWKENYNQGFLKANMNHSYKTKDSRYFQLHGGLNTTGVLNMLDLPQHRLDLTAADAVKIKDLYAEAVAKHDAEWLDMEANEFWRQAGTICLT
jgi:hypothetical protein